MLTLEPIQENCQAQTEKNFLAGQPFDEYKKIFVQRIPSYGLEPVGKGWRTQHAALHDAEIQKHLAGQQWVGCLARWYPEYAALDLDTLTRSKVDEVRAGLLLDDKNSMLFSSPSPDSYHIYFRPLYNSKPPTVNLLQTVLMPYAKAHGVEVYPQKNRAFRLPFGKGQNCLDERDRYIRGWEKQLYWLEKKDDFDLSTVNGHQLFFDFKPMVPDRILPAMDLGASVDVSALLENGLQGPSSRDWAQFEIIKQLWRQNLAIDDAWSFVWAWIRAKHNGYSRDFLKNPLAVREHIRHQVAEYYGKMQYHFTLPDRPHLSHKGYICEPDLVEIVKLCAGNLPRMRFAFELVKFMNPRRHRETVPVHSDKFIEWSSRRTYQRYLQYLEGKGVVERGKGYQVGERSKGLKLKWPYQSDQKAVLFEGRAVETLEKAVQTIFKPAEFKELLRGYVSRHAALKTSKSLFERVTL